MHRRQHMYGVLHKRQHMHVVLHRRQHMLSTRGKQHTHVVPRRQHMHVRLFSAHSCCRYSDILAAISPNVADKARTQAEKDQQPLEQAVQPVLQASAELDDIAQPTHRYNMLSQSAYTCCFT